LIEEHLAALAHHYGRANNPGEAVRYLTLAGKQAQERSAFAEAQAQLQNGIEWIKMLPESPEREGRELELASTLAQVLLVTRGFSAPETRAAAERARILAEKNGNLAQLVLRVFDIWRGVLVSGDHLTSYALAGRIFDLAEREGSPTSLALAHTAQQAARYFRKDLVGAEEHFAHLGSFFEAVGYRKVSGAAVSALGVAARCAWTLGHADSARDRSAQMIVFAHGSKNPYDLAFGRFFEGYLHKFLREPQHVEAAAVQAFVICEERGFRFVRDIARILIGWARAQLGSAGEGVLLIRQGLAGLSEAGARLGITDYLTCLAEAQALDGMIDDAISTIDEALQVNPEELVFQPNILSCRGELRIKVGQPQLAEADFREAITLAQKTQAKAWELRATTSLARLLAKRGKRDEARPMLAEIYSWFTEGFDTADLKDAKALLDELGA